MVFDVIGVVGFVAAKVAADLEPVGSLQNRRKIFRDQNASTQHATYNIEIVASVTAQARAT